jgi:hypothetical protein
MHTIKISTRATIEGNIVKPTVIVPETEVAGKLRPHPAVRGVTTQKFELKRELDKKESQK